MRFLIICLVLLQGSLFANEEFLEHYLNYVSERKDYPKPVPTLADDYSYLFVTGFTGEILYFMGYFGEMQRTLVTYGVPKSQIHTFVPRSTKSVEQSSDKLKPKILELYEQHDKPVVVIGHSLGGVTALSAAFDLENTADAPKVAQVYTVASAIEGAELADFSFNDWPVDAEPSRRSRGIMARTGITNFVLSYRPGMRSTGTLESRRRLGQMQDISPSVVDRLLRKKVTFIASSIENGRTQPWMFRPYFSVLADVYPRVEQDSMVLTRTMAWDHESARVVKIPGFGHLDTLTPRNSLCSWFVANHEGRVKKNRALMMTIMKDLETRGS